MGDAAELSRGELSETSCFASPPRGGFAEESGSRYGASMHRPGEAAQLESRPLDVCTRGVSAVQMAAWLPLRESRLSRRLPRLLDRLARGQSGGPHVAREIERAGQIEALAELAAEVA